jgi:hypothetical protein
MNITIYFRGSYKVSRLGFGIYESLSGGWLDSADEKRHRITSMDVGPVDDFGNIRPFSDAACGALDISFSN